MVIVGFVLSALLLLTLILLPVVACRWAPHLFIKANISHFFSHKPEQGNFIQENDIMLSSFFFLDAQRRIPKGKLQTIKKHKTQKLVDFLSFANATTCFQMNNFIHHIKFW